MPKPTKTKLHVHTKKLRPISIQKPSSTTDMDNQSADEMDHETAVRQFQLELCWCIQQLERIISQNKGKEKELQEAWKTLTVLKNNNAPIIRKRQLMRTYFGDYRAKMAQEEKKLVKMASKMKITEGSQPKATFLRKSAFLTSGESFRFNFNLNPEQIDKGDSNTTQEQSSSTTKPVTESGDSKAGNEEANNSNVTLNRSNDFRFRFTDNEFKFNFKVIENL